MHEILSGVPENRMPKGMKSSMLLVSLQMGNPQLAARISALSVEDTSILSSMGKEDSKLMGELEQSLLRSDTLISLEKAMSQQGSRSPEVNQMFSDLFAKFAANQAKKRR